MSLEQALSENTAAIKSLIEVWSKLVAQGEVVAKRVANGATEIKAGAVTIPMKPPKPEAAAALAASAAEKSAKTTDSKPVVPHASETPSDGAPSYDQVAETIRATVITNRDKVVTTLTAFAVKKGTELKPEQYADFMKALTS